MALFPAYTTGQQQCSGEGAAAAEGDRSLNWLTNSSFVAAETEKATERVEISSDSNGEKREESSRRSKSGKHKRKKTKRRYSDDSSESSESVGCQFYVDKIGDKRVSKSSKSSTSRRSRSAGSTAKNGTGDSVKTTRKTTRKTGKKKKKRKGEGKRDRYFKRGTAQENDDEEVVVAVAAAEPKIDSEEYFRKTDEFNKKLRDEPENDSLWLEYVQFQDKGEGSGRGIAEKKLSIIEKALEENPTSELLLNEKFAISEKIFPVDKLANDVKAYLSRDAKNRIGWKWMLRCNQFSLSRMTVPGVLSTYASALHAIHSAHAVNNNLLDTVLECGLFLRQAGLWEHLTLLLRLYLELNLTQSGSDAFKYRPDDDDDGNRRRITDLEDTIITCGLPLGSLWLRLEHLRESVNFVGLEPQQQPAPAAAAAAELPDDPQRVVFAEDVCHLLYPVERDLTGRLVAVALALVKVPPLPATHAFSAYLGVGTIDWALESAEPLLAVIHGCGLVDVDTEYISSARDLAVPPQYVNDKLGSRQFFNYVDSLFDNCSRHWDSAAVLTWRMRWWTLTVALDSGRDRAGLRSRAKQLLKRRRDDIALYVEYALLEREIGNYETALKVLETGILLRQSPLNVVGERAAICRAYRTLVEVLLKKDFAGNRTKALAVLTGLAGGRPITDTCGDDDDEEIRKAADRFGHLTTEITDEVVQSSDAQVTLDDVVSPRLAVSWLSCHAWFLYLTDGVWRSAALVEKAIAALQPSLTSSDSNNTLGRLVLEEYYVILVNVVHHFCAANPGHFGSLGEILTRAGALFPNNLYFLNIATVTGSAKRNLWKPSSSPRDSYLANIFRVFYARSEMLKAETTAERDNKWLQVYNLLKKLTSDRSADTCPFVWRIFLQFVASQSANEIKTIFYQSVEKCPWVKSIYYGAAQILPEELSQIQDLLVEKELRLHITPEEIEILREGDGGDGDGDGDAAAVGDVPIRSDNVGEAV